MYWQTSHNDKCRVGPFEKRSFDVKNSFDRGPIFCAEDFSHPTAMQNVNKYLSHGSHYLRYQNATQQKIILDDGKPTNHSHERWAVRKNCFRYCYTLLFYLFLFGCICWFFLKKWANPGLFYHWFSVFSNINTIFATNICEKCPSSMQCRDSNTRPLEHESPPITTSPGLPPSFAVFIST